MQYKALPRPSMDRYQIPVTGIENAGGTEGLTIADCHDPADWHAITAEYSGGGSQMQVSAKCHRARNFVPNSAVLLAHSCSSNERTFSVGWCDGYDKNAGDNFGPDPDYTSQSNLDKCSYTDADAICQKKYGGQLASITTQDEYDALNQLITGAVNEQYLLGLHSDGAGNWEYTDGTHANMDFLRRHSNEGQGDNSGLEGTTETNMVFWPKSSAGGKGGLHDCCVSTDGGWSNIEGFVCELFASEGQFAIGLGASSSAAPYAARGAA
jgi:hypothetical protein